MTIAGTQHAFRIHVPPNRSSRSPVVVQIHGGGSTGAAINQVTGLTTLADAEGFVVVTPEGWKVNGVGPQVWNAGACCGPTAAAPDHVAAFAAMLDRLQEADPCIDPRRIFVTGHSNGGMMSYRLACELGDRVAAVAVSAGVLARDDLSTTPPTPVFACLPPRPIPVLHVHGLLDACVPFEGGAGGNGVVHPAVEDVTATWRQINGCADSGTDETNGEVRRRAWTTCAAGSAVELVTVEGLGHAWAGTTIYGNPGPPPQGCGGSTTMAVSTTAEAWRFFQAHPMP